MSGNLNLAKFKLYMADTGLMVSLIFKDKDFTENTIYTKLLSNKLSKNLGILYENIVLKHSFLNLISCFTIVFMIQYLPFYMAQFL